MPGTSQTSEEVHEIISKAAYFSIFSVPDPSQLSTGVPLIPAVPASLFKIEITEAPHRHFVTVPPPSPEWGFRSYKFATDEQIANQRLLLEMIPNSFQAGFGRTPPPTLLVPFLSQRFYMSEGIFDFLDPEQSGFRAHAAGRFFPATAGGALHLRIGSIVEILTYLGALKGHDGNLVVNGYTTPPQIFANNFIIRFVDPDESLVTHTPPEPPKTILPDPEPGIAFIPLMAELDPDHPVRTEPGPDGKIKIHTVQRLRLVDTGFVVQPRLMAYTKVREHVGSLRTTLVFDPTDPNKVIPLYSENSEFSFFAGDTPIGTVKANLFEGRAFPSHLPSLERPFHRVCGFGPFQSGTGQFENTIGMVSTNGAMSLDPPAVSAMYMLRIADPERRFQDQLVEAAGAA